MDPEVIAAMGLVVAMFIPIVAILVKHQQKMAEIIHRSAPADQQGESLRREVEDLKRLLHQQAIQMDSLLHSQRSAVAPPQSTELSSRLES